MGLERLDKLLASQGVASRSDAGRMIRAGRVRVDGRVCRSPAEKADGALQEIRLDGAPLSYSRHVYIMLNKPPGLLCVSRDPQAATVMDLLPPALRRPGLFPAGRLDKDTVGLVLITDAMLGKGMPDGDFEFSGLHCRKHGQHVQVVETGRRAGSAIGMNDAVRMMGEMCGCTPCELVQMACVNPASLAQAENRKGRLAAGMDADLALFDKQWQCRATMVEGRWVYRR